MAYQTKDPAALAMIEQARAAARIGDESEAHAIANATHGRSGHRIALSKDDRDTLWAEVAACLAAYRASNP